VAARAVWSPDAVDLDPSTGEAAVGQKEIEKVFAGIMLMKCLSFENRLSETPSDFQ
jgi:hypothetical protein